MKKIFLFLPLLFFPLLLGASNELFVISPTNLRGPLLEISRVFEQNNPEWKVVLSFDAPSIVTKKARFAGKVDIIVGNQRVLENIKEVPLVSQKQLFSTGLVIVAEAETELKLSDIEQATAENAKKVALCKETTPLGKISREYLKRKGLWDIVQEKIVEVNNGRSVIDKVKAGEARWGITYSTEAARSKKVRVLKLIPTNEIPHTVYQAAIRSLTKKEVAEKWIETFQTVIAKKILENSGFIPKLN